MALNSSTKSNKVEVEILAYCLIMFEFFYQQQKESNKGRIMFTGKMK